MHTERGQDRPGLKCGWSFNGSENEPSRELGNVVCCHRYILSTEALAYAGAFLMPALRENGAPMADDGQQTHDDIEEIPEGVKLPDSSGSETPDVETPEPVDYSDVDTDEKEA